MSENTTHHVCNTDEIFVFGSNLAGRHGAGAAKTALLHHGARYGRAFGLCGNSFAIPTKDESLKPLPLDQIKCYVEAFLEHARKTPDHKYFVTRVGCGLAGYSTSQMAPMFKDAPPNCRISHVWASFNKANEQL